MEHVLDIVDRHDGLGSHAHRIDRFFANRFDKTLHHVVSIFNNFGVALSHAVQQPLGNLQL